MATRELRDAEEEFRKRGTVPHQSTGLEFHPVGLLNSPDYVYEIVPLCAQLRIEFTNRNRLEEIQREWDCPDFTPWHPGFTPKEHQEMLDRQWRLEWQRKQEDKNHRWRIVELVVLGFVSILIAGAFTIVGAYIQRSSTSTVILVTTPIATTAGSTPIPSTVTPIPLSTAGTAGSQPQ
jgi:hypothetical protein